MPRPWALLATLALAVVLAPLPCPTADGEEPGEFKPRRVVRPFPPIRSAPFLSANDVKDDDDGAPVTGTELVLGVVVGGEARAYPINMLTQPTREIINDVLGGTAIAATW